MLGVLLPAALFAQIGWTGHTIDNDWSFGSSVFAIDLDNDGDVDVLATGANEPGLSWWRNDGNQSFDKRYIGSLHQAYSVYAIDLNDDSTVDILGASYNYDDIIWWRNNGANPPTFTRDTIDANFNGVSCVFAADIDGDSTVDVLGAAYDADDICWWKNSGGSDPTFIKNTIDANFDGAHSVYAIDLDKDGDVDVLGAAIVADDITWWENLNGSGTSWTKRTIAANFNGAFDVYAIDINGDSAVDVLGAGNIADSICWWENMGGDPLTFTKHTIAANFDGASSVFAIDIDDDGDVDVLGAAQGADRITWWENLDGSGTSWDEHIIQNNFNGAYDVFAIDMDNDSDIDVLGVASLADSICWWESDQVIIIDARTISIDIPGAVPENTTLDPQATVKNEGTNSATFNVTCEIEPGGYTSTEPVNNLAPDDNIQVTFSPDFEFISGTYTVKVYTQLVDDSNPDNDTLENEVLAGDIDVSTISIDIPSILPDTTFNPHATVENFGSNTETFDVTCIIDDPGTYTSTETVANLASGESRQITFSSQFHFDVGSHTVTVFTELAGDLHTDNDTLENVITIDETPPAPFGLISPLDSTTLGITRPTFICESSSDVLSGLKEYEIYIDVVLRHTGVDTSWIADYDLQEGWHDWYVIAYDSVGNQRQSTETWSVLIDTTVPSVVTLVSPSDGVVLNNSTIDFIWNESTDNLSGIEDYVLQYSQDNTFSSGVVENILIDTTFTVALSDTIWYWRVKARDKATNQSAWSSVWSFEIDTQVPNAPNLVTPVGGIYLNDPDVAFEWSEVLKSGFGGSRSPVEYIVQVDTLISFSNPVAVDTTANTYDTFNLSEDDYYWRVMAYDLANQGPFSDPDSFGVDITEPSVPVLVSPDNGIILNINNPPFVWHEASDNLSGIEDYILQYSLDNSFTSGVVENILIDTTFTVALSDTIYYWRVKARDKATNESDWSSVWSFEIDTQVPNAPNLVSPVGGIYLNNTLVELEWSEESKSGFGGSRSPVVYILQVDTLISFSNPVVVDTTANTYDTLNLGEDDYYWRVMAYDLSGNEGPFSVDSFGVDLTDPSVPVLILPSNGAYLNNSTINFVWHESTDNLSGIEDYILQYSLDNSFTSGVVENILIDTTFTVALSDTIWYWRVKARDKAANEGAWSSVWSFEIDTEAPNAPNLVSPIGGIYLSDSDVALEWSEVQMLGFRPGLKGSRSPIKYVLQIDTTISFSNPVIVDTVTDTHRSLTLSENDYCWRVKAYDQSGNQGPYADPDSFGVDITAPVIDSTTLWNNTSFAGPFEIKTKVTDELSGVDSVYLYYKRDEDPDWLTEVMSSSSSPDWYVDSIPSVSNSDDTVRYYIKVVDKSQTGNVAVDPEEAPTDYYWFIANYNPGVMEFEDVPTFFSFGLKSNPAKGRPVFNLVLPKAATVTLRIYDVTGRLIDTPLKDRKSAGVYEIPWASEANTGVYFYVFESPWQHKVGKIVLVR